MPQKVTVLAVLLIALMGSAGGSTPATASPALTQGSVIVSPATPITAKNTGSVTFTTPIGTIECLNALLTGTVVRNSGSALELTIASAAMNGGATNLCSAGSFLGNFAVTPGNILWCIKAGGNSPLTPSNSSVLIVPTARAR